MGVVGVESSKCSGGGDGIGAETGGVGDGGGVEEGHLVDGLVGVGMEVGHLVEHQKIQILDR